MQKKHLYYSLIFAVLLLTIQVIRSEAVLAHKGHAGPTKIFMNEKEALKTMLPEGGKIVKRKEMLKKDKYNEAVKGGDILLLKGSIHTTSQKVREENY